MPSALALGEFASHWPCGVQLLEQAAVGPGVCMESCTALVDCCSKAAVWAGAMATMAQMEGRSLDVGGHHGGWHQALVIMSCNTHQGQEQQGNKAHQHALMLSISIKPPPVSLTDG